MHLMLEFFSLFQICTRGFACAFFCYDILSGVHRVLMVVMYIKYCCGRRDLHIFSGVHRVLMVV